MKGWSVSKQHKGKRHFIWDPTALKPFDGQFNFAFYGTERQAKGMIKTVRTMAPKYARGCKVVPVTLEMREVK